MSPLAQMIQLIVLTSLALGAVYFIFYRPTVDAQHRQRRVVAGLQPGDQIVTTSGFIATLVEVDQLADGAEVLLLDLGDGRLVRARPSAVAERLPRLDAAVLARVLPAQVVPGHPEVLTEVTCPDSIDKRAGLTKTCPTRRLMQPPPGAKMVR